MVDWRREVVVMMVVVVVIVIVLLVGRLLVILPFTLLALLARFPAAQLCTCTLYTEPLPLTLLLSFSLLQYLEDPVIVIVPTAAAVIIIIIFIVVIAISVTSIARLLLASKSGIEESR